MPRCCILGLLFFLLAVYLLKHRWTAVQKKRKKNGHQQQTHFTQFINRASGNLSLRSGQLRGGIRGSRSLASDDPTRSDNTRPFLFTQRLDLRSGAHHSAHAILDNMCSAFAMWLWLKK